MGLKSEAFSTPDITSGENIACAHLRCFLKAHTSAVNAVPHSRAPAATFVDFINVLKGDISHLFSFALLLLSLLRDPLHLRLLRTDVSLFFLSVFQGQECMTLSIHIMYIMKWLIGFRLRILQIGILTSKIAILEVR